MAAPKGNTYYLFNDRFFNPKKFSSPQEVVELWTAYVNDCAENPIQRQESHVKQGTIDVKVPRPLLKEMFCNFCGITMQTFDNYKTKEGYEAFFEVFVHIEKLIFSQNYDLGVTGVHKDGLVARKLGIADKKDHQSTDGTMKPQIIVSSNESKREVNDLMDADD